MMEMRALKSKTNASMLSKKLKDHPEYGGEAAQEQQQVITN